MKLTRLAVVAAAGLAAATPTLAHAQFNGSSVEIIAHNGFTNSCKDLDVITTVGAGLETHDSDWTGGCVGFYNVDIFDNGFQLINSEGGNYTLATLEIHFLSGPVVTASSFTGYSDLFFEPSFGYNDDNFTPVVTFDPTHVYVTFDTHGGDSNDSADQFRFIDSSVPADGSANFTLQGGAVATPEPATIGLTATGLFALFGVVRRRASTQA